MSTPKAGQPYTTLYEGMVFPVVLCRESLAPARMLKDIPSRGLRPAIALGVRKFIWVRPDRLEPYNPSRDYLQDDQKYFDQPQDMRLKRQLAFSQDVTFGQDDSWWRNYIVTDIKARRLGDRLLTPHQNSSSRTSAVHRSNFPREKESLHPIREINSSFQHPQLPMDGNATLPDMDFWEEKRAENAKKAEELANANTCIIFVGRGREPLQLNLDHIKELAMFEDYDQPEELLGRTVDLSAPLEERSEGVIPGQRFYFLYADLKDEYDIVARTNFRAHDPQNPQQTLDEINRLISFYIDAAKIGYTRLQNRIIARIQVLPMRAINVLRFGKEIVGARVWKRRSPEAELYGYRWLVETIADRGNFWAMAKHGTLLEELLADNEYLGREVFVRLSGQYD